MGHSTRKPHLSGVFGPFPADFPAAKPFASDSVVPFFSRRALICSQAEAEEGTGEVGKWFGKRGMGGRVVGLGQGGSTPGFLSSSSSEGGRGLQGRRVLRRVCSILTAAQA